MPYHKKSKDYVGSIDEKMTNLALNQNTYSVSQTNFSNIRRTPARACKKLYVRPPIDENMPVIKFSKGKEKPVKILERQNATRKIPLSKCVKDEEIFELTKHMEKLDVKFDSSVPSKNGREGMSKEKFFHDIYKDIPMDDLVSKNTESSMEVLSRNCRSKNNQYARNAKVEKVIATFHVTKPDTEFVNKQSNIRRPSTPFKYTRNNCNRQIIKANLNQEESNKQLSKAKLNQGLFNANSTETKLNTHDKHLAMLKANKNIRNPQVILNDFSTNVNSTTEKYESLQKENVPVQKNRSRRDITTNKNRRGIIPVDALPMSIPKMDNEIKEEINKELSETWRQKKGDIKSKAGRRPLKENVSTQNRRVSFINEDVIMKHKGKQRQKASKENFEINI
ncbi:hypothetical protein CDAR_267541 [Caerostris darwini]|uniref:Uncharacterized protein n=1 Tax=Caerostris darwini TaxID=1538125 RepID=A0AAV4TIY6_9ARAC|nr:hypothetical protein CDAR_267541 [Caerostris darwini]